MPPAARLCLLIGLALVLIWVLAMIKKPATLAWDFSLFYAAGSIETTRLYDLGSQYEAEHRLWEENLKGNRDFNFSPFLRPAYYRALLRPLAKLAFWQAFAVWTLIQVSALVTSLAVLARRYGFDPVWYILLPLCPYVIAAINWGQDAAVALLLLVLTFELLVRRWDSLAGAVLALVLIKWNIVLLLPLFLLAQKKWKAIATFLLVAAVEVLASVWLAGPEGAKNYFWMLRGNYADYLASEMPSLRGLLLLLKFPNSPVLLVVAAAVVMLLWTSRRLEIPAAFAVGVAASVFLTYHTMLYDLLFFFLPILVFQQQLQSGWKAGATVLFISPIPNLIGKFMLAATAALFFAAILKAALEQKRLEVKPLPPPQGPRR